ncbi:hypothetical protein R6Q59_004697 [Mikania micrantha]
MAGNRLRLKPYRYCKFCNSVVKSKELNRHEHSCLFKKAAAKASIIVMDGHCTFCKKIVRHTKDSPCKDRVKWLLEKALSGNNTCFPSR